jgi:hypothetical protein
MALKSNFNEAKSMKDIEKQAETLYQKIIDAFIYAAEEFIINARGQAQSHAAGQYEDVTANLRNSIGYYLFHNGEMIIGKEPGTFAGKVTEGRLPASEIASMNKQTIQEFVKPTGFQMILIAGMNYASYVESKGYNVISYQADVCMVDLAGYLENAEVLKEGTAARMEETFIP